MFEFSIQSRIPHRHGRVGTFQSLYHLLETPELAIVATEGEFKAIPREYWEALPCSYIIVNTFHINTKRHLIESLEKTILERVHHKKGIHSYMGLQDRTIASDSGGFQVFSLGFGKAHNVGKIGGLFPGKDASESDINNPLVIDDEGVSFRFDNREVKLNPEISMDIQHKIGADIMFAFDECTSPLNSKEYTKKALERTYAWLERCITAHQAHKEKQALFAIVQGGAYEDLRNHAARTVGRADVPGFGIGGSLGKTKDDMYHILEWVMPHLPEEKPRHLLGIGSVRDIFEGVERGVDLFDCVIPTREGRHGRIYTQNGWVALRKMKTSTDVIEKDCQCFGCRERLTYAQLWELYTKRDPRFLLYATAHNIWFFSSLMKKIRASIIDQSFLKLKEEYSKVY